MPSVTARIEHCRDQRKTDEVFVRHFVWPLDLQGVQDRTEHGGFLAERGAEDGSRAVARAGDEVRLVARLAELGGQVRELREMHEEGWEESLPARDIDVQVGDVREHEGVV